MSQTREEIALERIHQAAESGTEELDLSGLMLKKLPSEIGQLQNLVKLDLSKNELSNLPLEITQLTNLNELWLSNNELKTLPVEIGNLFSLTDLRIEGNLLIKIPPEIGHLQNLSLLYLSGNRLRSLPSQIGQLQKLFHLDLSDSELLILPNEFSQLQNLTNLYFRNCQLTSMFAEITQLQNLKRLDLSFNQLFNLPSNLVNLQKLSDISLAFNQFKIIPPEIFQLRNLTKLSLQNNQLTNLPMEIVLLNKLAILNLYGNELSEIPIEIFNLINLVKLSLGGNQIQNLPPEIGQLINLKELYLGKSHVNGSGITGGKLTSLPPEIGKLRRLIHLDLSRNNLPNLPREISNLLMLKSIDIQQNMLEVAIPTKWLGDYGYSNFAQEIIAYYKKMHEEGGRPLGEARVLVVGEADAGKTKLLRALLHGEHGSAFKDARDPTDGIEVNSFEADEIKVRYWDFGGQELYHATHRFFLSHRCVYVLVADATKDSNYNEEKIEYWLELLKFFGGDSPVILVASKVENYSLNVNERRLQEKYPNLVKMPALRTSAKTGTGIEDLQRVILDQVKSLPSVSVMLPRSFLAVKDALEEIKHNKKVKVIEDSVYRHLCEENGITEEERQNTLLALLHDMGVVLHYEDDRLSDFGILNPDWATGGVYKVVNSPQIEKSQGRFTLAELKTILADEELYPAAMRRRIVDLMKKFELTFELPFERDAFILPSALPRKQPELNGWDVPCMTFEYHYTLLQISIMHRFIVAEHDLIQDGLVWYSGLVISRGDNQALVIADTRDKRITIKVKGAEESRKEFLYSIRLQFERIHGEEVKPREVVYSPQYPDLPLEFEEMKILAKSDREYTTVHNKEKVSVNLRELLDGFITSEERRKDEEREKQEGKRGDTYNTYNTVNVHGNVQGGAVTAGEGNTSNITVQNSFNTFPPETQNALVELMKLTEALLAKAEESESKEELRDELTRLQNEASAAKTKAKIVKPIIERLADAAKNLNEIGKPVLDIAITVIKLINALP